MAVFYTVLRLVPVTLEVLTHVQTIQGRATRFYISPVKINPPPNGPGAPQSRLMSSETQARTTIF